MIEILTDKSDENHDTCAGCGRPAPHAFRIIRPATVGRFSGGVAFELCDLCMAELKAKAFPSIDPAERGAKVGRRHPDQSKEAAAGVKVGTQLATLLGVVWRAGSHGVTSAEAQPELSRMVGHHVSRNNTAAAMLTLRERGLVAPENAVSGGPLLRATEGGNRAQVWVITDLGVAEFRSIVAKTA